MSQSNSKSERAIREKWTRLTFRYSTGAYDDEEDHAPD